MMRGALLPAWLRRAGNPVAAAALVAGVLAAVTPSSATASSAAPAASLGTTSITVDGSGGDQTFMGIGAILGGGGNARYLMDYQEQQRAQILDYLFKPDYGASLQILKLEIGGGANSTDGSEPSIEPIAGQINCNAGYEFAIAKQAVTINPDIKLYGLQWSAPGWVSAGVSPASVFTGSYSPTNGPSGDIKYVIDWLGCAKQWGLTISYLGGWNESSGANGHSGNYSWYSNLRAAMDAAGYQNVQLIAGDLNPTWEYASSASPNPFPAISILGTHDVCGYPTEHEPTDVCDPPEVVTNGTDTGQPINTPQPLWASELGAMDGTTLSNCAQSPQTSQQPCADAMDRALVRGYYETRLDGNNRGDPGLTGYLEWPALDAMPAAGADGCIDEATQVLPHEDQGLITADQPWQGHYCVNAMTWAIAHFTQFVSPPNASNPSGWRYEDTATGYLRGTSADGSYVTFIKSGGTDWTTVIEATKATAGQTVNFTVTGASGLVTKPVHVWSSDFSQGSPASSHFMGPTTIQPNSNGQFPLTVQPGYVYTLTTTTGQSKGNAGTAPAAANFPLPYPPSNICPLSSPPNDSLACSGYAGSNDDEPAYLAAQDGSFELRPCLFPPPDGSTTCTEQTAAPIPVLWPYDQDVKTVQPRYPYAIIGDTSMTNYTVSADVLLTQNNTSAGLIARFGSRANDSEKDNTSVGMFAGYVFDVTTAGVWKLFKNTPTGQSLLLPPGTIAALGTGTWHHLALQASGTTITAWVDGTKIVSWTDPSSSPYLSGLAGIEAGAFGNTWPDVQYSNLKITSP
jgi:Glycosyl hydrolase family 59